MSEQILHTAIITRLRNWFDTKYAYVSDGPQPPCPVPGDTIITVHSSGVNAGQKDHDLEEYTFGVTLSVKTQVIPDDREWEAYFGDRVKRLGIFWRIKEYLCQYPAAVLAEANTTLEAAYPGTYPIYAYTVATGATGVITWNGNTSASITLSSTAAVNSAMDAWTPVTVSSVVSGSNTTVSVRFDTYFTPPPLYAAGTRSTITTAGLPQAISGFGGTVHMVNAEPAVAQPASWFRTKGDKREYEGHSRTCWFSGIKRKQSLATLTR
jgi:hypothetical protein